MSELKRKAAEKAVEFVEDGMTLGLGTGSTTFFAIEAIGSLVRKGYWLTGGADLRRHGGTGQKVRHTVGDAR